MSASAPFPQTSTKTHQQSTRANQRPFERRTGLPASSGAIIDKQQAPDCRRSDQSQQEKDPPAKVAAVVLEEFPKNPANTCYSPQGKV